eukprot:scaffold7_cov414-Pavlova_lutheri.AAC.11
MPRKSFLGQSAKTASRSTRARGAGARGRGRSTPQTSGVRISTNWITTRNVGAPAPEEQYTMPNPQDQEHGVLDREHVGRTAEDLDEDLVPRRWQEDSHWRDDGRMLIEINAPQQLMMSSMVNMQQELTRALQLDRQALPELGGT